MGNIRLNLRMENKELASTLEYLFVSTGLFDFTKEEGEDVVLIEGEGRILKSHFSELLSDILEKEQIQFSGKRIERHERKIKSVAMAALRGGTGVTRFSLNLSKELFKRGYKVSFLSLDPCNLDLKNTLKNEKGFARWLLDCRRNSLGPIEKYIFDDGEISMVGVPILNPNAGDPRYEDVEKLLNILDAQLYDFLIVDIGSHLDLQRVDVFKNADLPILFIKKDKEDEELLHSRFEGALPFLMDGKGERPEEKDVADILEEIVKGEEDE